MQNRSLEYKKIFTAEALQDLDTISTHLVELEKYPDNKKLLAEVFRLMHNLKANATAMGFDTIASVAHKLENVFSAMRNQEIRLESKLIEVIFSAVDFLSEELKNIDAPPNKDKANDLLQHLDLVFQYNPDLELEGSGSTKYYTSQNIALSELVSVPIKALDEMLNLVGELIIDRDRIYSIAKKTEHQQLKNIASHLYRITTELQESVMNTRLITVGALFTKFPRIVRDIAVIEDKKVHLTIRGEDIKIDRNILHIITDSLLHLIRNAVTHGIEKADERKTAGKSDVGNLVIEATSEKGIALIKVSDDGRGISAQEVKRVAIEKGIILQEKADQLNDSELLSLIFAPGFSMAKEVTEYSGRGVGLDIVKEALDNIGGNITIHSEPGKGTEFKLSLPSTIAVKPALLFEVNKSYFALPLIHIDSVVKINNDELHELGNTLMMDYKDETLKLIYLNDFLFGGTGLNSKKSNLKRSNLDVVIIKYSNQRIGLIVDNLLRQQEIIVKQLQQPVNSIDLFSGITLLDTGDICMILDVPAIIKNLQIEPVVV